MKGAAFAFFVAAWCALTIQQNAARQRALQQSQQHRVEPARPPASGRVEVPLGSAICALPGENNFGLCADEPTADGVCRCEAAK